MSVNLMICIIMIFLSTVVSKCKTIVEEHLPENQAKRWSKIAEIFLVYLDWQDVIIGLFIILFK